MDRLKREGNPPVGQLASPVPQYKDTVLNDWAELQGEGGASYVKDRDALAKLEQARILLSGVATEAKLEEARALLESVAGKDFATQATLAQVKSELELVKAELAAIKANQLSGDQKVQLSGNIATRDVFSSTSATVITIEPGASFNLVPRRPIDENFKELCIGIVIYAYVESLIDGWPDLVYQTSVRDDRDVPAFDVVSQKVDWIGQPATSPAAYNFVSKPISVTGKFERLVIRNHSSTRELTVRGYWLTYRR